MPTEATLDPEAALSRYRSGPLRLEATLSNATPGQLAVKAHRDGWTVAEVAHHIADGDDLWKACILAGLGRTVPLFSLAWYWSLPQDGWAEWWHYADRSVADTLAMFRANRNITAGALARTDRWWARPVEISSKAGTIERATLLEIVQSQADHAMQHIDEIQNALNMPPNDNARAA